MNRGFRIGHIGGIEVILDASMLIIFFLLTLSLRAGVFPNWHPEWRDALMWVVALISAALFVASLLVHELSHAVLGRRLGVDILSITLFIFGGMARLEREPHTAWAEFWMAIVGPLTSLLIGLACLAGGVALAANVGFNIEDPDASLVPLGPVATILLWLGPINILLAIFNLLPGFPLDGGRMLRAALWGITGDLYRATRWATASGRAFGLLLIAFGIAMLIGWRVPYFGGGIVGGLWLTLIGWFLYGAAVLSYGQLLAQRSLAGMPASRLMLSDIATVEPDISVSSFIDDYLIAHEQRSFPVVHDGRLVGLTGFDQVRQLPPDARGERTVAEIMTPASSLAVIGPGTDMAEALDLIAAQAVDPLPVVADGQVRGLLRREDIVKWLALRGDEEAVA